MRCSILGLALSIPAICFAQTAASPQRTPAQDAFFTKQATLRAAGASALKAESAREIVLQCSSELDIRSINTCMDHEFKLTQKNYQAYIHALSGLLQLGTTPDIPNPPGIGKEFDKTELRWTAYRDSQCRIVGNGALYGQVYSSCEQNLTRSHMDEIAHLYADLW